MRQYVVDKVRKIIEEDQDKRELAEPFPLDDGIIRRIAAYYDELESTVLAVLTEDADKVVLLYDFLLYETHNH